MVYDVYEDAFVQSMVGCQDSSCGYWIGLSDQQVGIWYSMTYTVKSFIIPPATKLVGGVYWNHPVRPSVCLSVCRRAVR